MAGIMVWSFLVKINKKRFNISNFTKMTGGLFNMYNNKFFIPGTV